MLKKIKDKLSLKDIIILAIGLISGGGMKTCTDSFLVVSNEGQEWVAIVTQSQPQPTKNVIPGYIEFDKDDYIPNKPAGKK